MAGTQRETVEPLLAVMYDFAGDADGIVSFLDHIGFDIGGIEAAQDLLTALPAFYRKKAGIYDIARLERDLITWEPVAEAIRAAERELRSRQERDFPNDL